MSNTMYVKKFLKKNGYGHLDYDYARNAPTMKQENK